MHFSFPKSSFLAHGMQMKVTTAMWVCICISLEVEPSCGRLESLVEDHHLPVVMPDFHCRTVDVVAMGHNWASSRVAC